MLAKLETYLRGDRTIWIIVIFLSLLSVLAVYSSTGTLAYRYRSGNTEYYLWRQFRFFAISFTLMYVAHLVKYTYYSRISQIAIYIAVPLLMLTLLMGTSVNQASRWVTLPVINATFQTSDFAKLALILYVARLLAKKQDVIKDFKTAFLPITIPVLIVCGLIMPANFSTAAVLFVTCLFLMFAGRVSIKYILLLIAAGVLFFTLFVSVALLVKDSLPEGKAKSLFERVDTWKNRIVNFTDKDGEGNYQADQAKMAIASGGIFGKGPGHCIQSDTLPHPYSDFIYAIILGESGMVGGVVVLILYLLLFFRSVKIVMKSPRAFASFVVIGCSFSLVFQAMINMAVAVSLFPVTGQPLPLVSMGGTSMLFTSLAIGIILSVSRESEKEERHDAA